MKSFVLEIFLFALVVICAAGTALTVALCLNSCTYNVSMAHTQGAATDVIDDNATNTPNIAPNVNIPMSPGSSL